MELQFSANLSKEERMVVHTLAEKYNLIHRSSGKGVDRALILKKKRRRRALPGQFML
jgi:predicted RNA-binding protein Jag